MFESDFDYFIDDNAILIKHKNLLKKLSDDRTMLICHDKVTGFGIMECCDEWFYHYLTKEECLELSEMFKEIADDIKD